MGTGREKGQAAEKRKRVNRFLFLFIVRDTYWKIIRDVVRKWYFSIEKWFLTALSSVLCFLPVPESAVRP